MIALFEEAYKGRKIIVTGSAGFKGAWLCFWLKQLGATVKGVDRISNGTLGDILRIEPVSEVTDITDLTALSQVIQRFEPDLIFHLAAQPLVSVSYEKPYATFMTNVLGTLNVLEVFRNTASVTGLVNVTSDKVYRNDGKTLLTETDSLGGSDPYSASKACAELLTKAYYDSFFANARPVVTARAGNIVGGGDWSRDRLLPDLFRALSAGETFAVRNQEAVRPWQHVFDALSGYLLLGSEMLRQKKTLSGAWNFGPEQQGITVGEVIEEVYRYWPPVQPVAQVSPSFAEHQVLKIDASKALTLGWKSIWPLRQTLHHTTAWYREYYRDGSDMYEVSLASLNRYVQDARQMGLAWASS